ncbi:MAG: hypothetical protein BGO82_16640 [Devosia sp. 67-54]|nr:MAG: hypothetical protein BGO82_16640 [Devosia sp. 67-54]
MWALFPLADDKAQDRARPFAQYVASIGPPGIHQDAVRKRDGTIGRRQDRIAHVGSMRARFAVFVQSPKSF